MTNTQFSHFSKNIIKDKSFEEEFFNSSGSYIHPTAIIGQDVTIGNNVKIGPYCVILGKTNIGNNTRVFSNSAIGFPAQNIGTKLSLGTIKIGSECEIREFVTIHASKKENGSTKIGNKCYIMNFSHIAHDVTLENNVILTNNVNLGGHVHIKNNAILMSNAAAHQYCEIGEYTSLAPFSATPQDLPPFCMFIGQPPRFAGLNIVGLKRAKITSENINALKQITKMFYHDKFSIEQIMNNKKNNKLLYKDNMYVEKFVTFIKSSQRGISRRSILDKNNK